MLVLPSPTAIGVGHWLGAGCAGFNLKLIGNGIGHGTVSTVIPSTQIGLPATPHGYVIPGPHAHLLVVTQTRDTCIKTC
jgi:hypothetical protein